MHVQEFEEHLSRRQSIVQGIDPEEEYFPSLLSQSPIDHSNMHGSSLQAVIPDSLDHPPFNESIIAKPEPPPLVK